MCDYSAAGVKQRVAVKGDKIISGEISHHTHGFVDINDRHLAVCLIPGTELAFDKPVEDSAPRIFLDYVQQLMTWRKRPLRKLFQRPPPTDTVATFVQVNKRNPLVHHDALEFADERTVLLQQLKPEQTATVVQLPPNPETLSGMARTQARIEQRRAIYN